MQEARSSSPFRLQAGPPALQCLVSPLMRAVEVVSGLDALDRRYRTLPDGLDAPQFLEAALRNLDIGIDVDVNEQAHIPRTGAALVVANHPFGGVDGMVIARLLIGLRDDVRILANHNLQRIPALRGLIIAVDPFQQHHSRGLNQTALRAAIRWLTNGGLLLVFPAGEVSHFQWRERRITDSPWSTIAGRLARLTDSPVVPLYCHGRNSLMFNAAGVIHPLLRTCLLPREVLLKRGMTFSIRIGRPVGARQIRRMTDDRHICDYLRLRTYLLREPGAVHALAGPRRDTDGGVPTVVEPIAADLMAAELEALPAGHCLYRSGDLEVYAARENQIPWTMQEIGRLREVTFRQAGEGTGRARDIDLFDTWYWQLFVWNREQRHIAGAYRLGVVADILRRYGRRGLYTYSLFRFGPGLLSRLTPAMELGRSFVREEYQRSHQALNLLWKGIGRFVARHETPILFGPVSISRDYTLASRRIIVDCLQHNALDPALARRVRPRRPFREEGGPRLRRSELMVVRDVDLISDLVAQMERDDKGVPVLVRQYLKLGGKFLGFNVDAAFSDVVDGLIVVDLRRTDPRTLARYMGREDAARFSGAVPADRLGAQSA